MTPRVSVLLTSYNRPAMLAEAIESVLAQTYTDFELLILDDNSTDHTVAGVLLSYWDHPQVKIYKSNVQPEDRRARVRYAAQINTGLKIAEGEYITYLCDDDLYLPHRLERMAERLDKGDCTVVYGSQRLLTDGVETGTRVAASVLTHPACMVDHSSVMHTARAAIDAGGWDDSPAHWTQADAVFWTRLAEAGHLFHPIGEVLDVHRYHSGAVGVLGGPY